MSPKIRTVVLVAIGMALGVAVSVGGAVLAERDTAGDGLPWQDVRLLAEVLERVKHEYVEPVDDHHLIDSAIRGMVTNLDSHSQFLNSEEYEEIRISTTGNYSGVGLEVNMRDGKVTVISPIEGTPAADAGIRPGDVIQSIDGMSVDEHNVNDAIVKLRGKPGTRVAITVTRKESPEPLSFDLVRGNVQVHSVRSQSMEPGIGYVRISQFSETTYADMRQAISDLRKAQHGEFKGLILDLRNNPGGVLDAAVDVSDAFLDSGVIVTASGRGREANFRHEARPGDVLDGAPIVVLVNGGSASASEIVAGALQDNKRATILGSQTFGKGSVQTVMPLSDGEAIKLTTSRYFTPSGASINGRGITPDILSSLGPAKEAGTPAMVPPAADAQVREALGILKGSRLAGSAATVGETSPAPPRPAGVVEAAGVRPLAHGPF
jgi:carboxyl-terminal processing protease